MFFPLWVCFFALVRSFPSGVSRTLANPSDFTGDLSLPSRLGDVDNDGVSELVFGQADPLSGADQGAVHVLFFRNHLASFQSFRQEQLPLHVPLQTGNLFGVSVCGLGDLDRDGYMETAVSCLYCDPAVLKGSGSSTSSGAVFILFMKSLSSNSSLVFDPEKTRLLTALDLRATTVGLGYRVSPAGDVNNDGVDDLLVSERRPSDGRFWLLFLRSDGSLLTANRFSNPDPLWGLSPRSLGDLNQDGVLDIVAWSPSEIHLMLLNPNGTAKTVRILDSRSTNAYGELIFPAFGSGQGFRGVEQMGDVNGDCVIDLLVSVTGTNSLYQLNLQRNGTAAAVAFFLGSNQSWASGGVTVLGDLENTGVVELIGLRTEGSPGLTVVGLSPSAKTSQATCYANPECDSGVCAVSREYSWGELPPSAGLCLAAWMTFSGSQGYAMAAGGLGSHFTIDLVIRYNATSTRSTACRDPILSRQNPSNGFIEFSLCILENNQISFRLSSLQTAELELRADIPPRKFVHVQVVGDGKVKVLLVQGRVVQMATFVGEWNGEGYALNLGQGNGKFLKANVAHLSFQGVDLLGQIASPCTDNSCTYPGSCKVAGGQASCVCPPGTTGDGIVCTNVDACLVNSCLYGVACLDDLPFDEGYSCAPCPEGTVGDAKYSCVDANFCAEGVNPCVHPETCDDLNGTEIGALCSCYEGETGDGQITGSACSDIDSCQPPPCPDGVTCVDLKAPSVGYACPGACPSGTAWDVFQRCVDSDACKLTPCYPGVQCTDLPPPSTYALCGDCPPGMVGTGYGANGCADIDTCLPMNSCFQGNCVSVPSAEALRLQALGLPAYYCRPCPAGYEGDGMSCVDQNFCVPSNLCFDQAACIDRPAPQLGYDCGTCPPGTTGAYGRDCVNVNACLVQPPPCFTGVNCTDEAPPSLGVKCGLCPKGFRGNGSFCEDINECAANPCYHNATLNVKVECINLRGSFSCGPCPPSFFGDGITCSPYLNPCAKCAGCVQVGIRSYRCSPCERGYITTSLGCLRFDPCSESPCFKMGNLTSSCTSLSPVNETFRCGPCPQGYVEDSSNLCVNYNACNATSCFPGAECYDLPPPSMGFSCGSCPSGYAGNAFEFTCQNYNACLAHPCYANVTCTDLPPPSVSALCAACPPGRVGDGVRCDNYDACIARPTDCFPDAECVDDPPPSMGYRCGNCPVGYVGDGKTCVFLNACIALPCPNGTQCRQHGEPLLSRSCTLCPMGFVEDDTGVCVDFDACTEHPCRSRQCHDLPPPSMGFHCTDCPFGTVVDISGTNCSDPDLCLPNPCPSPLLCVDLPGATGYRCDPETKEPTMQRPTPASRSGIMGQIHFPGLAWESWSSTTEEAFRDWILPDSVYNASSTNLEVNASDGGNAGGVLVNFRILFPFMPLLADAMMVALRKAIQGSGPPGFGRGRLVLLRSIDLVPTASPESGSGVELWHWILLGVGCLLVVLCCVGWALRKRKQRRGELEMQYVRKLQKEREGHQFPIEGDDIYTDGEEPWA